MLANKNGNLKKLKSPVLSMNTLMSLSAEDIMVTYFMDEESQSFSISEQARFQ
jgi:hypothetical protein